MNTPDNSSDPDNSSAPDSTSASNSPGIRVNDRERSQAMDRLSEYFADGYLDMPEFEERTKVAAVAKFRSDLEPLFADLPQANHTNATPALADAPMRASADLDDQRELERTMRNGRIVENIDIVGGVAATFFFFLGTLVFDIDYALLAFFLVPLTSGAARLLFKVDDSDEELYEELKEDYTEQRKKRLLEAAKRRKEIEG